MKLVLAFIAIIGLASCSTVANKPASKEPEMATTKQEIANCEIAADAMAKVFKDNPELKKGTSIEDSFCKKQLEHLYK
jgi:uncharacterized lipoprotein